ncbi:hypothetical protein Krac_8111 [Ktedonobacter racemifer DSM 44963]|uniref:Uncharacterized protein n=1 Tax=Ktedonobacter racemifer DSM 44963 TaxID=485913 RepID=D6TLZ6_KTERA|nr:hypothetical protein Krac_8111 [Ktedonobacter racemifer DSM 44963]
MPQVPRDGLGELLTTHLYGTMLCLRVFILPSLLKKRQYIGIPYMLKYDYKHIYCICCAVCTATSVLP